MTMPISGDAIASNAVNDVGHAYALGGAPGTNFQNPWDCSSAVSKWLGHDFGLRLPGSSKPGYDGSSHGPGSWQYISWSGAKTVSTPSAGCLVIWPGMGAAGHIGIAVSGSQMVSALNPALGTRVTDILATKPGLHIYRQITDAGNSSLTGCIPGMLISLMTIGETAHALYVSVSLSQRQSKRRRSPGRREILPAHIRNVCNSQGERLYLPRDE